MIWKAEREREARESEERKESAAASFFFSFWRPRPRPLILFVPSPKNKKPKTSPRRLRCPLDGGRGRRLDGHGVGPGRGEGLERPAGDDFLFVVAVLVLAGVGGLRRPEEGRHDDARRRAAGSLPPATGRGLGLDRHLELPGESIFSFSFIFWVSLFVPKKRGEDY